MSNVKIYFIYLPNCTNTEKGMVLIMKKSNLITLLFLGFALSSVIIFMTLHGSNTQMKDELTNVTKVRTGFDISNDEPPECNTKEPDTDIPHQTQQTSGSTAAEPQTKEKQTDIHTTISDKPDSNQTVAGDLLFIGDSRTVGLMEYAQIDKADFFCSTGITVFDILKKTVSVPGTGKVTLEELLFNKKYSTICIMLGVNEMGYKFESIVSEYTKLIDFIREREPESKIVISANLHVTKKRSDNDDIYNNKSIDRLNSALSELADSLGIYYINVNPLFDDADGALSADKSSDGTHLYAKYYAEWGRWVLDKTASLIREE